MSLQNFIRALKAPSDPPKPDGPYKIEIARQAWDDTAYSVPNKAETITEFVLSRLLKEKDKKLEGALADKRYWDLLLDTLYSHSSSITAAQKVWLIPLLNRTPIAPTLVAMLELAASDIDALESILSSSSAAFSALWPLASPKMSSETLMDCFGAFLDVIVKDRACPDSVLRIGKLVSSSLKSTFNNSSNKKRLHGTFLQSHLGRWVASVHRLEGNDPDSYANVYSTGGEILFNLDALKTPIEPSAINPLVVALTASEASYAVLPKLFSSLVQVARKHHHLFGQGISSTAEMRTAMIRFLSSCETIIQSSPSDMTSYALTCRQELFLVVDKENLLGPNQPESYQTLQALAKECIDGVGSADHTSPHANVLLQCLCILSRVDHDLVEPFVPRLFVQLLYMPCEGDSAASPAFEFLSRCIEYHSRARSLPTLVSEIQVALTSRESSTRSSAELHSHMAASPLLSRTFFTTLSKATRAFVTPGQVIPFAQDLLSKLENTLETYEASEKKATADVGEGPRKKTRRPKAPDTSGTTTDTSISSLSFSHLSRLAATVLSVLPTHTLAEAEQVQITQAIQSTMHKLLRSLVEREAKQAQKKDGDDRLRDAWAGQVVSVGSLEFAYSLSRAAAVHFDIGDKEELYFTMLDALKRGDILPELFVVLARFLLTWTNDVAQAHFTDVLDCILVYLETHASQAISWSGRSADLSDDEDGHRRAAVALFQLVIDRALLTVEHHGKQEQLNKLAGLLVKFVCLSEASQVGLSISRLAIENLRNAQFWEQHRFRLSILSSISNRIAALDDIDTTRMSSPGILLSSSNGMNMLPETIVKAGQAFSILLYTSYEYLSRTARADMLRRAVSLDMILTPLTPQSMEADKYLAIARTCINRLLAHTNSADHPMAEAYLQHLLRYPSFIGNDSNSLVIIGMHYLTFLRAAEKGSPEPVFVLVDHLSKLSISTEPSGENEALIDKFISVLLAYFSPNTFGEVVSRKLAMLFERVSEGLQLLLQQPSAFRSPKELMERLNWLRLFGRFIQFGSWLGREDVSRTSLSDRLTSLLLKSHREHVVNYQEACEAIFSLRLAEFMTAPLSRHQDSLDAVIASAVVFLNIGITSDSLETQMVKLMRSLSAEEFEHCLAFITEALADSCIGDSSAAVVRVGSVLFNGAPEGTLRTVSLYLTKWIQIFANYDKFLVAPGMRLYVLTFVGKQCLDRPASIRPIDMAGIWSILARVLNGSRTHNVESSPQTFHEVVTIVNSLVRFRRDLVLSTLPHLCAVLRQLILCLRAPRPNLGAKQYQIVADSLPSWIDPKNPLAIEDCRALTRLLAALATKSIIRARLTPEDSQKAESLAKPLSKHAAYIIQAYIEAVNDPLCTMSIGIRHELQSGLFILCGMLNEHDRNALMASGLDAAGKVTMKTLWLDYEKGRYVGQG